MADIVISGYYGLGNSGDEALLKSIVDNLREAEPTLAIVALSGDARRTRAEYGIATVNRFNPIAVYRALRGAKLLISGGGSLIQDATSDKSLYYYLAVIALAKRLGLRVMMYANGIGPLKEKNLRKVRRVLNRVDLITLREEVSLTELARCGVDQPMIRVTADPAFRLRPADRAAALEVFARCKIDADKPILAISVRSWQGNGPDFESMMARALDALCDKGFHPLFLPMQLSRDEEISRRILEQMHGRASLIAEDLPVATLLAVIRECTMAIGMRLHLLIFASTVNVPMLGIVYDPKIKGFMDYMRQTHALELDGLTAERLVAATEACMENLGAIKAELEQASAPLREKAAQNAQMAIELLHKGVVES